MNKILLDDSGPVRRPLWDPRTGRMEETNNRALQLLDRLMDRPRVKRSEARRARLQGSDREWNHYQGSSLE